MAKVKKQVKTSKKKLTKKELEELALQEQVSDTIEQANSEEVAVDTSSLPHYADASAGASSSTDATLSAPSNETVSSGPSSSSTLWALGGLGIVGIAAAAAGGGGSSASSSSSIQTTATSDQTILSTTISDTQRLATITEDDGDSGYWDGTYVLTYDANGYLDAEVYTNTSNSEKSYSMDYINDQDGYVRQTIVTRSDGTKDITTYTRDANHHAIKVEEDYDNDGTIDETVTIEYDADGNMIKYTEADSWYIETLEFEDGYLRQETIDCINSSSCDIYDEVINYMYTFNSDGKPIEINIDSTNDNHDDTLIFTYDTLGLLSSIQTGIVIDPEIFLATFEYDSNGNLIQTESLENGIRTYAWEEGAANGSAALIADFVNNGAGLNDFVPVPVL